MIGLDDLNNQAFANKDRSKRTKWYDVLSNKFYVKDGWDEPKSFKTFSSFFKFLKGDIYSDSCYFGYFFSEEEVKTFDLKLNSLNFDSLCDVTIDSYTYESVVLKSEVETDLSTENLGDCFGDLYDSCSIKNSEDLEKVLSLIDKLGFNQNKKRAFLLFLIENRKNDIKDALVDYVSHQNPFSFSFNLSLNFLDILFLYGPDAARQVIDNFKIDASEFTHKKWTRVYKHALASYESGCLSPSNISSYFDGALRLYFVQYIYCVDNRYRIPVSFCFSSFDKYIQFVDGDLRNADLRQSPLRESDLQKYKVDETTQFPYPKTYKRMELEKRGSRSFTVEQQWLKEDGSQIYSKVHTFDKFFDFVHFLKGDLSNTDFLSCEGIENISCVKDRLNLTGIKVGSAVAEKLGLPLNAIDVDYSSPFLSKDSQKNEKETTETYKLSNITDDDIDLDRRRRVSYISDLHLTHKIKKKVDAKAFKTKEDIQRFLKDVACTIGNDFGGVNLIAGDTATYISDFEYFVNCLPSLNNYFFVIGNHEISTASVSDKLNSVFDQYRRIAYGAGKNIFLVQNNLFYCDLNYQWHEIDESALADLSADEIKAELKRARLVIFGGVGFAGKNERYNADSGMYGLALNREREIKESERFFELYEKVTLAARDRNLIVLTHMPLKDWAGEAAKEKEGVIYVHGHTHRNYCFDDGKKRVYADNQVGYFGKINGLKRIAASFQSDYFSEYQDGVFEISKDDYLKFYDGIIERLTFNRPFDQLFMVKRDNNYMFFLNRNGKLYLLAGGRTYLANHDLNYYFDKLGNYSLSVKKFLSSYSDFQKEVSDAIKRIGGEGSIHGAIVDIDFYNHLYLNPFDKKITPYFAYSIKDKEIYPSLSGLLQDNRPDIYENYKLIKNKASLDNSLIVLNDNSIVAKSEHDENTDIYKVSRVIRSLQYVLRHNVVRSWNDNLVNNPSLENGRCLLSDIIETELLTNEANAQDDSR